MNMHMQGNLRKKMEDGFSLIETVLAIFVVGMGLLTVFALFPSGLAQIDAATADLNSSFFAGEVLGGMHGRSAFYSNHAEWRERWVIPVATPGKWGGGSSITPAGESAGWVQNIYKTDDHGIINHALRYNMSVTDATTKRKTIQLKVKYGRLGSHENTFYTEVYHYGM